MTPYGINLIHKHNKEQDESLEKVGFGMHRNLSWCEVPQSYLEEYSKLTGDNKIPRLEKEVARRKRQGLWTEK